VLFQEEVENVLGGKKCLEFFGYIN
jgi:hypothetical protein